MTVNAQKEGTKLTIFAEGKLGTTAAPELDKAVKNNFSGVTEATNNDEERLQQILSCSF